MLMIGRRHLRSNNSWMHNCRSLVKGHDRSAMRDQLEGFDTRSGPPHVVVARTTFGRGVSFMQSQIKWHYLPMSDDEYRQAMAEVERG